MRSHVFAGVAAATAFLCVSIALPSGAGTAETSVEDLRPGATVSREIAGDRSDSYQLALQAGEYARIDVDQQGIDVVVRISDRSGALLTECDLESRPVGREQTIIVSESATTYRVAVKPRYGRAPAGKYAITLAEVRPADDKDRKLYEAIELSTKAVSLRDSGKIEESRADAARAVALGEQALGPNDPYLGHLLLILGYPEGILAHYAAARDAFGRSAKISEAALGHDDPQTALALENLGSAYARENDFANAEKYLKDALKRMQASLGPEHPRVAFCHLDLAFIYQFLDPSKSAAELEPALRIVDRTLDPDEFIVSAIANNLGATYRQLHEYDRAEPLLRRALRGFEKARGPAHPLVAYPLLELGIIARERKQYDQALALLWRAEAIREATLGAQHPDTVNTYTSIGEVLAAQGKYTEALDVFRRNLQMFDSSLGPYNERTLSAATDIARTYAAQGNVACAVAYQKQTDRIVDKDLALNLAIGSERQKLAYAESMADSTDRTISLHVDRAPNDSAAAELALLVILQRKGRVLDAMAENLATIRAGLDPADQPLLDRFREKTAELAKVALSSPGKGQPAAHLVRINALEAEDEKLEDQIGAHSAAFRAQYQPTTIAAVRKAIPQATALVEFSLYRPYDPASRTEAAAYRDPHYVVYVLRRQGRIRWKDLGNAAAIDAAIARWRRALRNSQDGNVDALARSLDRKLMQPVRLLTGDASQLLISPDGQLGLVPFEALVDSRGRYAIESYSISYLTSGRDLLRLGVPRPASKTPPVIVADPLFGEPGVMHPAPSQVASLGRASSAAGEFANVYFGPLAATREEARSIQSLFPEARLLTGKAATKKALEELDAPEMLHVATHGFFLSTADDDESSPRAAEETRSVAATVTTTNPLLRSGLALSGANLTSGSDDGVLTALEASTLNLWGTKLVTLSACDSGVGEVKNGEGVYGLRRAFILAGAETVVMSLWPVSDYATREVMTAYYAGLRRGLGRGAALRTAQLAMLKTRGRRHPFYWASFIQSGDWTPLRPPP